MSGYPRLDETGLNTLAQALADATKQQGVIKVCETEAEWNQKTQAEKDDPNIYWFLPWRTSTSGEINDNTIAPDKVWSSQKVNSENTALKAMVTDDYIFSPTKAYAAGDWLIHNNILYEVITACTGVTPPNSTYYKVKTIKDAITDLNNKTVGNGTYVTVASYSALQTALTNKVAMMTAYTIENMVIACSAVFTEFPSGGSHAVQIYKGGGNTDFSAIIQGYHTGELKYINCLGGTWNFRNVSFKEDTATALTVTSGTTNYTIISSYAYRYGNHIHAEVYGTYGADVTTANQVPFFTISGIKAPSAAKYVGTVIIMDTSAKPILTIPALAQLGTNKYIYERATNNLSSGYRVGFIVDYYES